MANGNVIDFPSNYEGSINRQHFTIDDLVESTTSQISLALIKKQGIEEVILKFIYLTYPGLKNVIKSLSEVRVLSFSPGNSEILFEINGKIYFVIFTDKNNYLLEAKRKEKLEKFLKHYGKVILSHFVEFHWSDLWRISDFSIKDSVVFFYIDGVEFGCYNGHNIEIIELLLAQGIRLPKNVKEEKNLHDSVNNEMKFLEDRGRCIAIIETRFPYISFDEIEDIAFPNIDNQMIYFRYKGTLYSVLGFPKNEVEKSFTGYVPYPNLYRVK